MAKVPNRTPRIGLDGRWFASLPAGELGFLGDRLLCELGAEGAQPPKKLLLRPISRPKEFDLERIPDGAALGVRPFAVKAYQYATVSAEGKLLTEERQFLQQEVTGLLTLRDAILKVVTEGSPRKVWHLFYSACKALNGYAKAIGGQRSVPLQCPNSLAVDAKTGQVIVLDAEIRVSASADASEGAYVKWFGPSGRNRSAPGNDASLLHSKGLVLFFREVLGYLNKNSDPGDVAKQLGTQLDLLAAAKSPQELEDQAEMFAEDWSLAEDEVSALPVAVAAAVGQPASAAPIRRPTTVELQQNKSRSWLAWFLYSFLANLLLAALVVLLATWWLKQGVADGRRDVAPGKEPGGGDATGHQYSSYCIIFPAPGTSDEKVLPTLKELFPDQLFQEKGDPFQLLESQKNLAIKSLKDVGELKKLLEKLNSEHAIRFSGYDDKDKDSGLKSIIDNGSVYKIGKTPAAQHGSLLRSDSVQQVLTAAGMQDQADARGLLESLQSETIKYASIKDAILIRGSQSGIILRVEPTAKAHAAVRAKLLGHPTSPVFVPRPAFELFGAVDPAAGEVTGLVKYSLKLDRQCYWRWVGADDRKKTDYAKNPTNAKMKWRPYAANEKIEWTTLPVLRLNSRTDPLSTFDIAVALNTRVVVFRNQSILTGESRNDILKQARGYLAGLGFTNLEIEDAVSVGQQGDQFTGALLYNFLADQAKASRDDLEIMPPELFEKTRKSEDSVLVPTK